MSTPNDALPMWVVYDHPRDYPQGFIARLFYVRVTAQPTPVVVTGNTLDEVRKRITPGLTMIPRDPSDSPSIVETWL